MQVKQQIKTCEETALLSQKHTETVTRGPNDERSLAEVAVRKEFAALLAVTLRALRMNRSPRDGHETAEKSS
jgi:hypothetical protein